MIVRQELETLGHCVFNLNYHLVFATKYRRSCLSPAMRERLKEIFANLCTSWGCELMECNGEEDHMHLLVKLTPKVQPSIFVNNLKTVSSRLLRRDFATELGKVYKKRVLWSRTYCLLTCGGAPLSVIKQYIEQQAQTEV